MGTVSLRRDGRGPREMRGKELRTSELSQFDGSAWYSQGLTAVVAAVNGPVAARQEDYRKCGVHVYVNRAVCMPRAGGTDRVCVEEQRVEQRRADGEMENFLAGCVEAVVRLEQFPRCVLELHLTVLADDGALLAVAANAVMCALLDAGTPCRTTIAAVSIAACGPDVSSSAAGAAPQLQLLLDPTGGEEAGDGVRTRATATFVLTNPADVGGSNVSSGGVLASHLQTCKQSSMNGGSVSSKELVSMIDLAERAAGSLFTFFRNCNVPLE